MSVYTLINRTELNIFLQNYSVGSLKSFEGISAGIENTNYFVTTSKGEFILTIFEHHTFEDLPYFLNIMAFMAEHNIPTAHPIQTIHGEYLIQIQSKPAALVQRLKGKNVATPSIRQCKTMGEAMAVFHVVGQNFSQLSSNNRNLNWINQTFNKIKPHLNLSDKEFILQEIKFQQSKTWQGIPEGIIHADLFCDNVLFDGEKLTGIIDLYYACNFYLIYDLAVMVNDWCSYDNYYFDQEKIKAMTDSYNNKRAFSSLEKKYWTIALRLAALRFYISRLEDKLYPKEGEITQIKDPEVFKKILQYHQQNTHTLL